MTRLRSESWWNDPDNPGMTALYLERFLNFGLTPGELQSGRPVIGIAQSGSDLTPCNRVHLETVERARDGVRDAGGIPLVFPMHPIQESVRRPTAALDRNLAYLGLVEILHGYPLDGVILTTACDKTTPAALMAAVTVNLPAIILSGGPMLNSYLDGKHAGAGTIIWEARRRLAAGLIDAQQFGAMVAASAPSPGHCNTMGTALSMNSLAEAMGMSLPGCATIPAPYRERLQMAYATGRRSVELVREGLTPSKILTREAFHNAVVVNTALGGSTNCPPHVIAIARHAGVDLPIQAWETEGYDVPLLVNLQPAGKMLGEDFHRAGGVPVVMRILLEAGKLHGSALTVTGRSVAENVAAAENANEEVIRPMTRPLHAQAGFLVLSGNLFEAAIIKTSVISEEFRRRYLRHPGQEGCFECRAVVFEGPEDYHARINDPTLGIDESTLLVIRGCGPVGFPGSAEVVNMLPPDALVRRGINELPTLGDGRQSGTSASPSILNASPEAAAGGGLARLRTGDRVRIDLNLRRVDALVPEAEWRRRDPIAPPVPATRTPWEHLYRQNVGQLATGACLECALAYRCATAPVARHNH
jgi:dihydroxy-acid dehydratase